MLLIALAGIIIANITDTANSQTCDVPRYAHEPIHVSSWLPGTHVTVQIDDSFSDSKRNGIEVGNQLWNNALLSCSGVTFNDFDPIFIDQEDVDDTPPQGYLVWQEDDPLTGFNGGVFMEIGFAGWVEAARIKIRPNLVNIANGTYFNYLGTHEVGHTFNLKDCLSNSGCPSWTEATIMTGHADGITSPSSFNVSGPKACDLTKVREIYCSLGTPTPTPSITPTPTPQNETDCQNSGGTWNSFTSSCEPSGWVGPLS
jgi:hypothetical protein